VDLTPTRFAHDTASVEQKLREVRLGSIVVTYHGSTARIPASYDLEVWEPVRTDCLRVWKKRREADGGAFFAETDAGRDGVWHFNAIGPGRLFTTSGKPAA
jgi:hypothetical protein